jgi:hypothetical protein
MHAAREVGALHRSGPAIAGVLEEIEERERSLLTFKEFTFHVLR